MSTGGATPETIWQSWNVPDLKKRLTFLIISLGIFVFCTHIPAPGIDPEKVREFFQTVGGQGLFNLIDLFSGGALKQFSILALGIMPYINASIMMQLMVAVDPKIKEIQQEGEEGRKKISKWTRYLAVTLAFLQGGGMMYYMYRGDPAALFSLDSFTALISVVGGTCFLMWLGDEISQRGVGNGVSIIIMVGIVSSIPAIIIGELAQSQFQHARVVALVMLVLLAIVIVTAVVFIQLSVRKIPIQYARRQIGRKIYGGQSTYLPIKVTQAGVIPIIFAISVLMVPATIIGFFPQATRMNTLLVNFQGGLGYLVAEFTLVFVFTFVWTAVTFNTQDIAENLRKNNGFIPGIRPGKPTFDFLDKVLHRVTFFGATFLASVAILPVIVNQMVAGMTGVMIQGLFLGGTSLLIVVGVALDTVQQMQAHLVMRHYSGFGR
ncbi:preprotein translocase subunit SecY [bacterium]|nr:preprotein translocase subunit SecY [bacterium]